MFIKELFGLILKELDKNQEKDSIIEGKIVKIVEEIDELEEELAEAIAGAERWGDINDNSHWRTVEVNRLKRVIQAKERMIDKLKNNI